MSVAIDEVLLLWEFRCWDEQSSSWWLYASISKIICNFINFRELLPFSSPLVHLDEAGEYVFFLYLSQQSRAMAFMASIFLRISFASAIWQRVRTRLCSG